MLHSWHRACFTSLRIPRLHTWLCHTEGKAAGGPLGSPADGFLGIWGTAGRLASNACSRGPPLSSCMPYTVSALQPHCVCAGPCASARKHAMHVAQHMMLLKQVHLPRTAAASAKPQIPDEACRACACLCFCSPAVIGWRILPAQLPGTAGQDGGKYWVVAQAGSCMLALHIPVPCCDRAEGRSLALRSLQHNQPRHLRAGARMAHIAKAEMDCEYPLSM